MALSHINSERIGDKAASFIIAQFVYKKMKYSYYFHRQAISE
jgi:hypothetical protein